MIIDESKLKRQEEEVDKAIQYFMNGTRGVAGEFVTGFGKTYMAFLAIRKVPIHKVVHIVVPTEALKKQWEDLIVEHLPGYNVTVFIINTYVTQLRVCDLLVSDEGHRYSNEEAIIFSTLFDICTYASCWVLSAKFSLEQLLFLESKGIKLISRITAEEAKRNGWVSKYKIYNLVVDLTDEELEKYKSADNRIKTHFPYFNHNLKNVYSCCTDKAFRKAYCEENGFEEKEIAMRAVQVNKSISERKGVVYNAVNKKQLIADIVTKLNKKTIVFAQTIKFCQDAKKLVPNSTIYHSTLKPKEKEKSLVDIITGRCTTIFSVKALQEGLDVRDLSCGIAASYTSTERDAIQTLGRIIRAEADKQAIFINLYCKDTIELGWLKTRQKSFNNIRWITSIDEIEL